MSEKEKSKENLMVWKDYGKMWFMVIWFYFKYMTEMFQIQRHNWYLSRFSRLVEYAHRMMWAYIFYRLAYIKLYPIRKFMVWYFQKLIFN